MHGPHGPGPGVSHQLSSLRNSILSFGMSRDSQTSADSLSFGARSSPLKQVIANFSIGMFRIFVRNSNMYFIASFFS